jgi:GH15 family glucan-1,4-alpha-glucosidase
MHGLGSAVVAGGPRIRRKPRRGYMAEGKRANGRRTGKSVGPRRAGSAAHAAGAAGKAGIGAAARIEDYALIGDCETAALVSREGSIDWLCWPTFASGACFAALLGTRDHGFWKIAPAGTVRANTRRYQEGTLIVETVFKTAGGEVCVTDFMPPRGKHSQLVRMVRGERGRVKMRMDLAIRFDYGRTVPWVTTSDGKDGCELRAVAGRNMAVLQTTAPLRGRDHTTYSEFTVRAGETVCFALTYCTSLEQTPAWISSDSALTGTKSYWKRWLDKGTYRGEYAAAVQRSLITLKAMTYKPTGGIVAAATTSLPEEIGGVRNWDYRYCWLRDTSFTLLVLLRAGYREEALAWRRWLLRAVAGEPGQVQTIYGISGEREMTEWEADWLPGYEGSKPVRIGNGAAGQFQLDVFGEVASALARMPEAEDDIRLPAYDLQTALANHLCEVWHLPDEGIWEVRGGPKQFVHSKVSAWVGLDRAIEIAELAGKEAVGAKGRAARQRDVRRWKKVRDEIHREVCEKGFDKKLNSFVQAYGSKVLDASCLRIVLVGFLPASDPRIRGTVDATEKGLMKDGLVQRYDTRVVKDGLKGAEGQFLACSFWMVTNLWLIGRRDDAKRLFERLLKIRNDVGLLSEEYDSKAKRMVGNFPQALSHIALVHAAFALSGDWTPKYAEAERDAKTAPAKKTRDRSSRRRVQPKGGARGS